MAIEYIVWPTFYVNNGDVTAFSARYFNSLNKNEFMPRIRKTDGQIGRANTILCAVEF